MNLDRDGVPFCLHAFVVTDDGDWVVVQQGMNERVAQARRYHWRSEAVVNDLRSIAGASAPPHNRHVQLPAHPGR